MAESHHNSALSTYYEHRIFMLYQPDDFRMYLGRMADGPNWMRDSARNLDLMAWGTLLVYQARMEPFAFNERLTRLQDQRGVFLDAYQVPATPLSLPLYRLQLTMQLALEAVTRRASIDSRIDEEPAHAQLIFDALYYVAWLHREAVAVSATDRWSADATMGAGSTSPRRICPITCGGTLKVIAVHLCPQSFQDGPRQPFCSGSFTITWTCWPIPREYVVKRWTMPAC